MKAQAIARAPILLSILLLAATSAQVAVAQSASGSISASPDPCMIPNGQTACTSAVTWSTQNVTSASVTVEDAAGGGEVAFASGLSGSQSASIQAPPHQYTFRLYDTSSGTPVFLAATGAVATGSGTLSALPNPCAVPEGGTSCSSTIGWNTSNVTSAQLTVEDTAGGGEVLFASTTSGSQAATIQLPPHQYTFRLYDTSSGSRYLIAAFTVLAEGAGTLTATPSPCPVDSGTGTCASTITWSTRNAATAEVTVEDAAGGGEVLFASGLSGSQSATIQLPPHQYNFRLYDTSSGSRLLIADTVVVGEGTGTVSALPDPCTVPGGETSCGSTIGWSTQHVTTAQLTVQDAAGGGEVAVSSALSGSQSATIQLPPHEYTFRLYDTSSGSRLLIASATVVATGTGAITGSPDPCAVPGGSTTCTSTLNWNVINALSAQVTVQDAAGGGEVLFATGVSGSQGATIQLTPHKYTFRLYDTSSGSAFFVASTVVVATGTGTLSASPDPCSIPGGSTTCASTVTWSTQNVAAANVTVEDAVGGGEVSFASGISGSKSASLRAWPHLYTFRLYDISSGPAYFLASWQVVAIGSGTISASPNPCKIGSGLTSCSSTVSWSTANVTTAKVTVQDAAGGGETNFATGLSGSQSATIQGSPHSYTFRLYDTSSGTSYLLNAVTVTGGSAPAAPSNMTATAGSITSGTGKKPTVTDFVNLAWQDNSNNENDFIIERCQVVTKGRTTSCLFSVIATVGANVTAFQDNNVARQTTYKYFVQAQNSFGISGASNVAAVTTP